MGVRAVALTATIYTFTVELADSDRGVYETLELRVARHPSETEAYLVTRLLAYCLEYREGIRFSKGVSTPEEPAILVRDPGGACLAWIDIGAPAAARLHKAGKAAERVAVYTHKEPARLLRQWSGERIHRAEALELYSFDRALIDGFVARLQRRMSLSLAVTGGHLYLSIGDETLQGAVERHG
jgi:uncharacterized protein YaeQ